MSDEWLDLPPAPREVSSSAVVQELLGDALTQIGLVFVAFGLFFVAMFAARADLTSWYVFRGALESAQGRALSCADTHASEGGSRHRRGTPIYAVAYEFDAPGGGRLAGTSYARGGCPSPGSAVIVEWPAGHPETSRVAGLRTNVFSAAAAFTLIFPLIGLGLAAAGIRGGLKDVRLLARGTSARGRLVDKAPTNVKVNHRTVYALTFAFVDGGGVERRAVTKTAFPELLESVERENLFYDPADPSQMVTVDTLPALIRVGDSGRIEPRFPWKTAGVLLVPGLIALELAAWWLLRGRL
jgi:hypothetical protein